eukprot:TRINITY_DN102947_c0_g1_i1.p1 TRINITY_DN102947_c0_g1~~TRINITY_DN102947_c0_g1_i1.p1  ORF type:complete len:292 (+),score=39.15 TRINITY_DN102947_c0_g1_i1:45-920(+)
MAPRHAWLSAASRNSAMGNHDASLSECSPRSPSNFVYLLEATRVMELHIAQLADESGLKQSQVVALHAARAALDASWAVLLPGVSAHEFRRNDGVAGRSPASSSPGPVIGHGIYCWNPDCPLLHPPGPSAWSRPRAPTNFAGGSRKPVPAITGIPANPETPPSLEASGGVRVSRVDPPLVIAGAEGTFNMAVDSPSSCRASGAFVALPTRAACAAVWNSGNQVAPSPGSAVSFCRAEECIYQFPRTEAGELSHDAMAASPAELPDSIAFPTRLESSEPLRATANLADAGQV